MKRTTLRLSAFALTVAALSGACTLISEVDRSKIAEDDTTPDGMGGDDGTGGDGMGGEDNGGTGGTMEEGGAGGEDDEDGGAGGAD